MPTQSTQPTQPTEPANGGYDLEPWCGVWLAWAAADVDDTPTTLLASAYTILPEVVSEQLGVRVMTRQRLLTGQWRVTDVAVVLDGQSQPDAGAQTQTGHMSLHGLHIETRQDGGLEASTTLRLVDEGSGEGSGGEDRLEITERRFTHGAECQVSRVIYHRTRVKQVICYRRDLKMRKGKIAAQCAHAAMAVFFQRDRGTNTQLKIPLDGPMAWWFQRGFAKVVLSVDDEAALLTVAEEAAAFGLPHAVITDSGRTEFHGVPTRTTIAIGPAPVAWIDRITGRDGLVATKLA